MTKDEIVKYMKEYQPKVGYLEEDAIPEPGDFDLDRVLDFHTSLDALRKSIKQRHPDVFFDEKKFMKKVK